jgi:hypothetical protein
VHRTARPLSDWYQYVVFSLSGHFRTTPGDWYRPIPPRSELPFLLDTYKGLRKRLFRLRRNATS